MSANESSVAGPAGAEKHAHTPAIASPANHAFSISAGRTPGALSGPAATCARFLGVESATA